MLLSASNGYDMAIVAFYDLYCGSAPESAHVCMVNGQDKVLKLVIFLKTFDYQAEGGCFVRMDVSCVATRVLMVVEGLDNPVHRRLPLRLGDVLKHSRLKPFCRDVR